MSSRELEQEVEYKRAELDLTIDRLQHRLSPFGLMDETLGLLRSRSFNRTGDAMMAAMRRDPLPALLIAAGVGLLLYRATQPRVRRRPAGDVPGAGAYDVATGRPYPPYTPADAPAGSAPGPIEPVADPRPAQSR
ncbi:DUF3618 domain-containing protein [Lutibaculum baratangense]|uniref:DUF3618 domain-containing protein n=1 Tax=Lutibaculum baratangense AMV1 TaxID=631454 RepID=V4RJB7_9HYPH|nr:DUF3618 domain-containing protein [Lutibaculum baratangense]ESR26191.1 hypothetical protein N177_1050 [Lutibaculum baratangense AMV1]